MSEITRNLALPLIAAAQAQKHVTHNEALVALDGLVQLACLDKDLATPPPDPAEGDRYLVLSATPTGAWAGLSGQVACFQDGQWIGLTPKPGWLAWILDEGELYARTAGGWVGVGTTLKSLQNLTRLGIGTIADAGNPFAAKLNTALWSALTTGEGGSGDLRYTLNKQAAGNVLSLLFQSGFSARAELGLTGDDDLTLKVSADGGTVREALRIDRASGNVDWLAAEASLAAGATVDLGSRAAARITVTGAGAVTSFGTAANRIRFLRFTGAATLTHNAVSLVLPGAANLVTAAGDTALAASDAAGNWTLRAYQRANGRPVAGAGTLDATAVAQAANNLSDLTDRAAAAANLGLGTTANVTFNTLACAAGSSGYGLSTHANSSSERRHWRMSDSTGLVATWHSSGGSLALRLGAAQDLRLVMSSARASFGILPLSPGGDNVAGNSLGEPALRWPVLYAATGSINTSDAREKTPVEPLGATHLAAATALAREIGTFRFLEAVARKGDGARIHVGLTVQRAIAVLTAHGLDPFALGLVCHDTWGATDAVPALAGHGAEHDADGRETRPAIPPQPAVPGIPAGERYGFRTDQLLLFLARGFDARLSALEAKAG